VESKLKVAAFKATENTAVPFVLRVFKLHRLSLTKQYLFEPKAIDSMILIFYRLKDRWQFRVRAEWRLISPSEHARGPFCVKRYAKIPKQAKSKRVLDSTC
jgi:hypothetical protein